MKRPHLLSLFAVPLLANTAFAGDVLPSWNDTPAKNAIIAFVERVTKPGAPDFVRAMRIYLKNGYDGVMIPDHTPQMTCAAA